MSSDDRGVKVSGAIKRYIQKNGSVGDFGKALDAAEPRPKATASGAAKEQERIERRNYAQRLSEALAVLAANLLRANGAFPGVLPAEDGGGQESRARTGKGVKKLDVNYSTPELGLGLGVSIKTINFRDPKSVRYTKNPTRLDNELRAEAMDYHDRQPYSVLIALVFVPRDSCTDGDATNPRSRSSFAQIVNVLRHRAGRAGPRAEEQLFERVFVGLYDLAPARVAFFDVTFDPVPGTPPPLPRVGEPDPRYLLPLDRLVARIVDIYDTRNNVKPAWEAGASTGVKSLAALEEEGAIEPEDPGEDLEVGDD
jgi:hypothetical protein